MTTQIYYFSGTGNSLSVARGLAAQIDASLISIPHVMDCASITPDADVVGLVFPVYHKGLPLILQRFVEKLTGLDTKYVFGACTYGDTSGMAIKHLRQLIRSRGGPSTSLPPGSCASGSGKPLGRIGRDIGAADFQAGEDPATSFLSLAGAIPPGHSSGSGTCRSRSPRAP